MPKNQFDDKGKVKFRFVEFELEGSNSTIEDSIKSIVSSMNRAPIGPVRTVPPNKQTLQISSPTGNENGQVEDLPMDESQTEDADEPREESRGEGTPGKPRKYTVPKFLKDLDLDSGTVSFKKFADEQKPESDNRKYIVIAAWLKKHRNLDVITPDHIYTCNQKMAWKTQRDVGQPFRQMKKKSYFDAAGRNLWSITHVGLDQLGTPEE